jgi:hypothetical protein
MAAAVMRAMSHFADQLVSLTDAKPISQSKIDDALRVVRSLGAMVLRRPSEDSGIRYTFPPYELLKELRCGDVAKPCRQPWHQINADHADQPAVEEVRDASSRMPWRVVKLPQKGQPPNPPRQMKLRAPP